MFFIYSKLVPFLRKNPLAFKPMREMVQLSGPYVIVHVMYVQGSGFRERVDHSVWIGKKKDSGTGLVQKIYDKNKARAVSDLLKQMAEKGFLEAHQIDELNQEYALPNEWNGDKLEVFPFLREEIGNWLRPLEHEKPRRGIFKSKRGTG